MDSLIVLRKPLRKTQMDQKFTIPKKSKKAVHKAVEPIPVNSDLGEESNKPPISFVKLYRDLCVENSIRATSRVYASSPTRVRMCLPARVHLDSTRVDLNSAACVDVNSLAHVCVSPALQFECSPGQLHVNTTESRSDTSLVTHYLGTEDDCSRVFTDVPPPSSARAELILELDYDTSSKDSGFC